MNKKIIYETPVTDVIVVKMEHCILEYSNNSDATRESYGAAIEDNWD